MIQTIRIATKKTSDSKGESLLADIKKVLNIFTISKIRTSKVYRLEGVDEKEALHLSDQLLYEPIDHDMTFNSPIFTDTKTVIEISCKPGVMNPEVASILKSAKDLGINLIAADSSWEYAFYGKVTDTQIGQISKRLLINDNIEFQVKKQPMTLLIKGKPQKTKVVPVRNLSDKQLLALSSKQLFLNLEEMKLIQNYFKKIGREPTDCEVEILAQTWSEHCVHKTFKANLVIDGLEKEPLYKRIKSTLKNNPDLVVSAFVDNSGVIDFYDGYGICGKVETHNSPSAIEPYGGAMTGAGGVFRDVLGTGQGARVISATDIFCFAPWDLSEKDLPPGCLPPDYLFKKVVYGIRDYGNRVGIPTNNGSVHFHRDFKAKPTVAAGAYGLIPKKLAVKKSPKVGSLIVLVGGKTGRDGIHGATFSSGEMTHKTMEVSGTAVQIGNAIEEKRVIDAVLDLRDHGFVEAITDCGAGGLSSAVGEMAEGVGAKVQLEKVPLKYEGLAPWEIFLSESQERMVLAISPRNKKKMEEICDLHNVEVSVIGVFGGGRLLVKYGQQVACDLDINFLHQGLPQRKMVGITRSEKFENKLPVMPKDFGDLLLKILSHGNVASKECFVRMYDHNVQGTNTLHPFSGVSESGPNDGSVIAPIYGKPYGMVVAHGLNPGLNKIDPYNGSLWAIIEAVSNYVAIGGDIKDAALIDNFIWPFPDSESLADLDKSVDACVKASQFLGMPFVSGKDSLSSTYRYPNGEILKIPPVLLISVFGRIPDVRKTMSSDFKKNGSVLVHVGRFDLENLGGSVYFEVTKSYQNKVAQIDIETVKDVFNSITEGIRMGKILSVHDISEGGLAATLSEMCIGGSMGAIVDLEKISKSRPDLTLFSETAGNFIVEVESEAIAKFIFGRVPFNIIGRTIEKESLRINYGSKIICKMPLKKLEQAWLGPVKGVFA